MPEDKNVGDTLFFLVFMFAGSLVGFFAGSLVGFIVVYLASFNYLIPLAIGAAAAFAFLMWSVATDG